MSIELNTADFNYNLPACSIAQKPNPDKQNHKILHYNNGELSHHLFKNICDLLPSGATLVINDSQVIPSRLFGKTQASGKIEIFLTELLDGETNTWLALAKPLRKTKPGMVLTFIDGSTGTLVDKVENQETSQIKIRFEIEHERFQTWLQKNGHVPLPPYIKRPKPKLACESLDNHTYQTCYASAPGSIAAPTAGLHFSNDHLQELRSLGFKVAPITLHVGLGTFMPVKTVNHAQHKMHSEKYLITEKSSEIIQSAINNQQAIVTVGTTSFRCLESFYRNKDRRINKWLDTDIFIYPKHKEDRYRPIVATHIVTNFHQPESTLIMLIAALIGLDQTLKIYQEALEKDYKFLSYGDTSLIKIQ